MNYPRVILAGTHSGVGKTMLTLGIILALRKKGVSVQPFKTGPDYIDPTYHSKGSGKICGNLDSWLLSKDAVIELFKRRAKDADLSVIEGVMGLYDGLKDNEQGSTAHLAKILSSPVILILDARSLSRSAAATALGYKKFDSDVDIAGILLNNIASTNHYHYIRAAIERKTRIPVLGYLPKDPNLKLSERHLGLIPLDEKKLNIDFCKRLSKLVRDNIDLSRILKISRKAKPLPYSKNTLFSQMRNVECGVRNEKIRNPQSAIRNQRKSVTIAVAKDEAFNFYYQDNLDILRHLGARVITFRPLKDKKLPKDISGLYIGGGFPELFASQLARNSKLKDEILQRAEDGLPIYAECGGLMYLMERIIDFKGSVFPMTGIFKGSARMASRQQALGYVGVDTIRDNILSKSGQRTRGHIFHWSYLDDTPNNITYAYRIVKDGDKTFKDGLIKGNVLASYTHLHFASDKRLAKNFIDSCLEQKGSRWSIE